MNGKLIDKKIEIFEDKLADLGDDFAFNDDGDVLIKDVPTILKESIEIM